MLNGGILLNVKPRISSVAFPLLEGVGDIYATNSAGDVVVFGIPGDSTNGTWSGKVIVYQLSDTNWLSTWQQKGNILLGQQAWGRFGLSVDINAAGDRIVVGFSDSNTNSPGSGGTVRVYTFNGNTWNQLGADIVSNVINESAELVSMNGNGNIISVSSRYVQNVYRVYSYNGTSWVKLGVDIIPQNNFSYLSSVQGYLYTQGGQMKLNKAGNIVAIGTPSYNVVHVFSYNGSTWTQLGQPLNAGYGSRSFGFGIEIDDTGNTVAASSFFGDDGAQVFVSKLQGTAWSTWFRVFEPFPQNLQSPHGLEYISLSGDGNKLAVTWHLTNITENPNGTVLYSKWGSAPSYSQTLADQQVQLHFKNQRGYPALNYDGSIMHIHGGQVSLPSELGLRTYKTG